MSDNANLIAPQAKFPIFGSGASQHPVRMEGKTDWPTQRLIAEL